MCLQVLDNLEAAQVEFDMQVMELNKRMDGAKENHRKKVIEMNIHFAIELESQRIEAEKEMKRIIAVKDEEMKRMQAGVDGLSDRLKVEMNAEMTQKLKKSAGEMTALRSIIDEKDEIIEKYEAEMGSFRQSAKLTWKVAKQKITERRGR